MKKIISFLLIVCLLLSSILVIADNAESDKINLDAYVLNEQTCKALQSVFYSECMDYYCESEAFVIWYLADNGYYLSILSMARQDYHDPQNANVNSLMWESLADKGYVEKLYQPKVGRVAISKDGKLHIVTSIKEDAINTVHYSDLSKYDRIEATYSSEDFVCYLDFMNAFDWHYGTKDYGNSMGYSVIKTPYIFGDENGNLSPEKLVTRAEFMTILSQINQINVEKSDEVAKYSDIKGHWAYDRIQAWTKLGVINGYPDGTFRPDETISAAQAAVIICRNWDRVGKFNYFDYDTLPAAWEDIHKVQNIQGRTCHNYFWGDHWIQFKNDPDNSDISFSPEHWAYKDVFCVFPIFAQKYVLNGECVETEDENINDGLALTVDIDQPLNREQVAKIFNVITGRGEMCLDFDDSFGVEIALANMDISHIKNFRIDPFDYDCQTKYKRTILPRK